MESTKKKKKMQFPTKPLIGLATIITNNNNNNNKNTNNHSNNNNIKKPQNPNECVKVIETSEPRYCVRLGQEQQLLCDVAVANSCCCYCSDCANAQIQK